MKIPREIVEIRQNSLEIIHNAENASDLCTQRYKLTLQAFKRDAEQSGASPGVKLRRIVARYLGSLWKYKTLKFVLRNVQNSTNRASTQRIYVGGKREKRGETSERTADDRAGPRMKVKLTMLPT